MGLDKMVWVAMACLEEMVLPLTLTFPSLSTPFPYGIGGSGACTGHDGDCEG